MGGVLRGWPVGAGTLAFGSESAPADPGGFGPVGAETVPSGHRVHTSRLPPW